MHIDFQHEHMDSNNTSQHLKKKRCVRRTQVQTVKGKRYTGH